MWRSGPSRSAVLCVVRHARVADHPAHRRPPARGHRAARGSTASTQSHPGRHRHSPGVRDRARGRRGRNGRALSRVRPRARSDCGDQVPPRKPQREQIQSPGAADPRADIYSLGVTLYETCVGRPPFVDENQFALMMAHVSQQPPPPSRFRDDLPPALEKLILDALAKNPSQRPSTCAEFGERLRAAVPGADATETPAPTAVRELPARIRDADGDLILVPAGTFKMGPARRDVHVDAFYVDRVPVTAPGPCAPMRGWHSNRTIALRGEYDQLADELRRLRNELRGSRRVYIVAVRSPCGRDRRWPPHLRLAQRPGWRRRRRGVLGRQCIGTTGRRHPHAPIAAGGGWRWDRDRDHCDDGRILRVEHRPHVHPDRRSALPVLGRQLHGTGRERLIHVATPESDPRQQLPGPFARRPGHTGTDCGRRIHVWHSEWLRRSTAVLLPQLLGRQLEWSAR